MESRASACGVFRFTFGRLLRTDSVIAAAPPEVERSRWRLAGARAGRRDSETLPGTDVCRRTRPLSLNGVARVIVMLPSEKRDKILPILDRWAALIRRAAP